MHWSSAVQTFNLFNSCLFPASIHCVHPYEPSYQIFNGMEQNAFISPFIKITFAYGLYVHHHFDESEDKDLTFKKGAPISHTQTGSC